MIRTNLLKSAIATKGLSQRQLAFKMDMTDKTFYAKMKRGVFNSGELMQMVEILDIKNVKEIFFAK